MDTPATQKEGHRRDEFPTRRAGLKTQPFSSSARSRTHIVCGANGRVLEISDAMHAMLELMDGMHSRQQIAARLSEQYEKEITASDVDHVLEEHFLPHGLLEGQNEKPVNRQEVRAASPGLLLCPASLLFPVTGRLRVLFRRPFLMVFSALIALCQWAAFHPDWILGTVGKPAPLSPRDYVWGYLLLLGSVLFHELGHLSACSFYGARHGELRVGLYLIFPVFYANVTDAWTLPRRARVMVDLGGIYFQMLLCIPALLVYRLTGAPLCIYFCMGLLSMALLALNPFLRFDGYWVCSDLLGVPNLRSRSRAMLKQIALTLLGRNRPVSQTLQIRTAERIGLINYAILSHLFMGVFAGALFWFLPRRLLYLSASIAERRGQFAAAMRDLDIVGMLVAVLPVLLTCVLLVAIARMSLQGARRLGQFLRQIRGRRTAGCVHAEVEDRKRSWQGVS